MIKWKDIEMIFLSGLLMPYTPRNEPDIRRVIVGSNMWEGRNVENRIDFQANKVAQKIIYLSITRFFFYETSACGNLR